MTQEWSWWNEYIYIAIWFVIVLCILLGVSLSPSKDTFTDVTKTDDIDLQAFFQPYSINEVCTLFQPVYESVVHSFTPLEGQAARDEADKEVKKHVPGGKLSCSLVVPSSKDPQDIFNFLSSLPDTYLADVYATLLYSTATLQSNLDQVKSSLSSVPPTPPPGKIFESFDDVCSPKDAEKKRATQAPACILPEDVTPEALTVKSKEKLATLVNKLHSYTKDGVKPIITHVPEAINKDSSDDEKKEHDKQVTAAMVEQVQQRQNLQLSYTDLLQKGKDLLKEFQTLKAKLEAGDVTPPQSESFTDLFSLQYQ